MNKIFFATVLSIVVMSCTMNRNASSDSGLLLNKKWTLTGWGKNNDALPATMKEVFIQFETDRVNGQSGCNNYFGSYTVKGSTITFGKLGSTMMACNEESMAMERKFHDALEKANKFMVENNVLKLYQDKELIAQFK
ncbi:META domain-containing protein [Gynurincola endophyticus]|uniref:META domain-containing protein n=1 Tax=Gynurincola endophyticus TaxID=2479004 RepID=UPI000F8D63A2|nr:META domain-containing protein [Gynurincola endophyticus]